MFNKCYWLHDASILDFGFETAKITFRTELYYNLGMPGPLPQPGGDGYATGIVEMLGVRILNGDPQEFVTSLDGEILSLLPLPTSSPFSDRIQLNALLRYGLGNSPDVFASLDFELDDIDIAFQDCS